MKHTIPAKKKFTFGLILTSCMLLAVIILAAGWWWAQHNQAETVDNKIEIQSNSSRDTDTDGKNLEAK